MDNPQLGNLPGTEMTADSGSSSSSDFTFVVNSSTRGDISAYTYETICLREIRDYTQHLCGRIKTIIDAVIADQTQNRAVKDLVHDAFWTEHYSAVREWVEQHVADLNAMDPTKPHGVCKRAFPFYSDKLSTAG